VSRLGVGAFAWPVAIGMGAGAEFYSPMAVAIITLSIYPAHCLSKINAILNAVF
jgi:hypothetical protein